MSTRRSACTLVLGVLAVALVVERTVIHANADEEKTAKLQSLAKSVLYGDDEALGLAAAELCKLSAKDRIRLLGEFKSISAYQLQLVHELLSGQYVVDRHALMEQEIFRQIRLATPNPEKLTAEERARVLEEARDVATAYVDDFFTHEPEYLLVLREDGTFEATGFSFKLPKKFSGHWNPGSSDIRLELEFGDDKPFRGFPGMSWVSLAREGTGLRAKSRFLGLDLPFVRRAARDSHDR